AGRLLHHRHDLTGRGQDDVRRKRDQIRGMFSNAVHIASPPADVDARVAADGPARFLQTLQECREASLSLRIFRGEIHQHADAAHALTLLRAGRERPRRNRASKHFDEVAPSHAAPSGAHDHANSIAKCSRRAMPEFIERSGGLRYLPTERAAIAFSICSLIAAILKLAPPCIGGKSMNDCAACATCCWTNTKRQNS